MTLFTKDSILTFGKYKGETVKSIIKDDPDYIAWACDEIEWFELDNEASLLLENYLSEKGADDYGWWINSDSGDDGFLGVGWFDFD